MWMVWREAPRLGMDRERVLDLTLWLVVWGVVGRAGAARDRRRALLGLRAPVHRHLQGRRPPRPRSPSAAPAPSAAATTSATPPPAPATRPATAWRRSRSGGAAWPTTAGSSSPPAFGLYYARKHRLGMWRMADLAAPWIALGLALTRMGCFLNGCCFGKPRTCPGRCASPSNRALEEAQVKAGLIAAGRPAAAGAPHPALPGRR